MGIFSGHSEMARKLAPITLALLLAACATQRSAVPTEPVATSEPPLPRETQAQDAVATAPRFEPPPRPSTEASWAWVRPNWNRPPVIPLDADGYLPVSAAQADCAGGLPEACLLATVERMDGGAARKDAASAIGGLIDGCHRGTAHACALLGDLTAKGLGVRKDRAQSASLYRMACYARDEYGCVRFALALERGEGVEKDRLAAMALFTIACSNRDARACFEVGVRVAASHGMREAERFYADACDMRLGIACRILGDFDSETDRWREAARRYFDGCDKSDVHSCTLLGRQYCFGLGVDRDQDRCMRYLRQACNDGDGTGCSEVQKLSRSNP